MSVGVWAKPTKISSWTNLVEMDGGAGWKLGFHASKAVVWTTCHVKDFIAKDPTTEGEWSHIAATWDGKKATIYVNRKVGSGGAISGGGKINVAKEPSLDLGYRRSSKASYFSGLMDEMWICNRLVSIDEIKSAMAGNSYIRRSETKTNHFVVTLEG